MTPDPVRVLTADQFSDTPRGLVDREWLVTNGLGGYASGTLIGAHTRRYHGLLISALPGTFGRMLMLGHLSDRVRLPDGTAYSLGGEERSRGETLHLPGARYLREFRLILGLPVWRYEFPGGHVLEKRLFMPNQQNTTYLTYKLVQGDGPLRLKLRPSVHFRSHDAPVDTELPGTHHLNAHDDRIELKQVGDLPPLRLQLDASRWAYTIEGSHVDEVFYRLEYDRGYAHTGRFWSPGYFRADLHPGHEVTLIASTESWEAIEAMAPAEAEKAEHDRRRHLIERAGLPPDAQAEAELVLAADQFLIVPVNRPDLAARAHAAGDDLKSVIAGYHWFTDWGRDTMISLEGLALRTGRWAEARNILRTFGHAVRDGLIPNLYPEGDSHGLYHTADATLWFFHALDRYHKITGDLETVEALLPKLLDIAEHHLRGTRFHIHIDPEDGLFSQGEPGYQLTWMDAKVGDWVVTPRRGKAVELNALWYNALRNLENWLRAFGRNAEADRFAGLAEQTRASFNQRFWYAEGGYLYDVVDGEEGNDTACRPNQIFSISLPNPVLDPSRWEPVFKVVRDQLLTPVGLRSLAPNHPDYKAKYFGDLHARDAAYHQGTVWGWLIGPYVDAYLKLQPSSADARPMLNGLIQHLNDFCVGSIAEIFDAEPPFRPRGCVAQAWSVAETLRALLLTRS